MPKVHAFTQLGLRTLPIGRAGYKLVRDDKGKKHIVDKEGTRVLFKNAMPSGWTDKYGAERTVHKNTPLGGVICGALSNLEDNEVEIIALDCDNQQAWDLFTALHPTYGFRYKSVGKPGGTVIYKLPESLRALDQYSVSNQTIKFEYMAKRNGGANAMVYLPTAANETKETLTDPPSLETPPQQIIDLIQLLKPQPQIAPATNYEANETHVNLPFNAPLIKQFVADSKAAAGGTEVFGVIETSKLVEKVYRIFTPKKFRGNTHYADKGWVHPNSDELLTLGSWSEYIVGVSAIAGADPSISAELYADFMQTFNAQVDDPMPTKRFLEEVIQPMVFQKAKIHGKPIWKYNEKWDQTSHTIVNQYGETLEYFTLENAANRFIEYNHTTKELVEIPGPRALRDQIYAKDTDPQQEVPAQTIVKKLKLIRVTDSVKMPLGIFTDNAGHTLLNTIEPAFPLRVLRDPELVSDVIDETNPYVVAYNCFISHLMNSDPVAVKFLHQVIAYHGKHLEAIPVILYIVGVGGAGKSHLGGFLELLFGANATSRPSAKQVTSQYNDFLLNTALLILSETGDSADKAQEGIKGLLKTVTGEKTVDIEVKRQPLMRNVPVFALPVLLANDPWYKEDSGDRRLFSIMPKSSMLESTLITDYETAHGVRIVSYIEEGIKLGIISKYLSTFCPQKLPGVPLTADKQQLSLEQADPIMVVKNLVQSGDFPRLFDMLEEYDVELFFTAMESTKLKDKDCIFKNVLVELVKNIRGADTFSLTDASISRAFSVRWMPLHARQYRPRSDNPLAKRLGYVKWLLSIARPYEDWKVEKLRN